MGLLQPTQEPLLQLVEVVILTLRRGLETSLTTMENVISSVRLHDQGRNHRNGHNVAKIDLHTRKNGFPAAIVDDGDTGIFEGSLGWLGEWGTGKRLARDGVTEMNDPDATAFAQE